MEAESKNSYDEKALLIMLSKGSEVAFKEIYHRYKVRVYATAYDFLKSHEQAEEILQEVFLTLWIKRKKFANVKNLHGYLLVMSRNLTIDLKEKLINEKSRQFEFVNRMTQVDAKTDHRVLDQENNTLLKDTLALLTDQEQKVFQLSREKGLSNEDIATQLQISQRTVESHIYKAVKTFKERLRPHIEATLAVALPFFF